MQRRKNRRQQEKPEEVCIAPGLQFSISLTRYIDGSARSRGLIISVVIHEEFRWIFSTHRGEMYLASGANLSRSEHHSFSSFTSSCFISPYGCAHRRGIHVREACYRRTREMSVITTDWRRLLGDDLQIELLETRPAF